MQRPTSMKTPELPLEANDVPAGAGSPPSDEAAVLKGISRDVASLLKPLEALAQLKASDPEALDHLEKALTALPSSEQLARALDELRTRATQALSGLRDDRVKKVGAYEAEFIRAMRQAGHTPREAGASAWRVGPIEIELQRERARARARYNKEAISPWQPVSSAASLVALHRKAQSLLESSALPTEALPDVLWWAYDHLRRHAARTDAAAVRIPLPEFYREVRVALARMELSGGKADRKLARIEFPRWAFLYNLDRYRKAHASVPAEKRLALETGSQHDHSKGLAMVLNGLDAGDDYKSYCYVFAPGAP